MINNYIINSQWRIDYLLVQETLNGNVQSWDTLYSYTYPIAYNYVKKRHIKRGFEFEQIEDIVGEAFKRCYGKLDSFRGGCRFSTWVCGFCRYIMLECNYKCARHKKYETELVRMTQPSYAKCNPENIAIRNERDLCLWTAFDSLSSKHRMLLQYYVLNEVKFNQINKYLKMNYNQRIEELAVAMRTLRRRFIHLYEKKR